MFIRWSLLKQYRIAAPIRRCCATLIEAESSQHLGAASIYEEMELNFVLYVAMDLHVEVQRKSCTLNFGAKLFCVILWEELMFLL